MKDFELNGLVSYGRSRFRVGPIAIDLAHEYGGDALICINNKLTFKFNLMQKDVVNILPSQIYNYEIKEDVRSKIPLLSKLPHLTNRKTIRIEFRDDHGNTWIEYDTPEPQLLEDYLKENVKLENKNWKK